MEAGNVIHLVKGEDVVPYLDHRQIVDELINAGGVEYVARIIDKLYVNHEEIAFFMINHSRDGREALAHHINNFHGVNHNEVVNHLMENVDDGKWFIGKYIHNFAVDHTDVAHRLIDAGWGLVVAKYLHNFRDLNHNDIVLRLLQSGSTEAALEFRDGFEELNDDVRIRLYGRPS